MVVGALGVLADLTVSQASTVIALSFSIGGPTFTDGVNSEAVAEEIIASLVGSIGLIASMPITTGMAALLAVRMPERQLEAAHVGHVH
ncbi:MAG TPA: YibE/F family protein [Gaiellaceae bacterium]|jgi:uncharacterized membrane protein